MKIIFPARPVDLSNTGAWLNGAVTEFCADRRQISDGPRRASPISDSENTRQANDSSVAQRRTPLILKGVRRYQAMRLAMRSIDVAADFIENACQIGSNRCDRANDSDGDQRGDKTVFNRCRARLLAQEFIKPRSHV
jgi:hypothetical protein